MLVSDITSSWLNQIILNIFVLENPLSVETTLLCNRLGIVGTTENRWLLINRNMFFTHLGFHVHPIRIPIIKPVHKCGEIIARYAVSIAWCIGVRGIKYVKSHTSLISMETTSNLIWLKYWMLKPFVAWLYRNIRKEILTRFCVCSALIVYGFFLLLFFFYKKTLFRVFTAINLPGTLIYTNIFLSLLLWWKP